MRNQVHMVAVQRKQCPSGVDPRTIRRRAEQVLRELNVGPAELSVMLCGDQFIRELNREYRQKDKPTDVLSFPMESEVMHIPEANELPRMLGDVVISIETAERQAIQFKRSLLKESTWLLIHGILHLLGYTHETDKDEREMNHLAVQLLAEFRG